MDARKELEEVAATPRRSERIAREKVMHLRPQTRAQLHAWLEVTLDLRVSTRALLVDAEKPLGVSDAPFEYLAHAYFEGDGRRRWKRAAESRGEREVRAQGEDARDVSADCVVWAARGTGKTFLGAVATLLDLIFKPGIQIKILGGSLEQSRRMHEHLCRLFQRPGLSGLLDGEITARRVQLLNGSRAEVLAASQTSVRGSRVQKVRCDEVELFDPELWRAAQLTTRSAPIPGPWGPTVRGSVEALSTMHEPGGLMSRVVSDAKGSRRVFRWGVIDVLGPCEEARVCGSCALEVDCGGRAKERSRAGEVPGFVSIDDAIRLRSRVDQMTWESEMLCLRPRMSSMVYEEFDPQIHVLPAEECGTDATLRCGAGVRAGLGLRWIAGMDFGIRSETAMVLASVDAAGVVRIEREHVRPGMRLEEHLAVLRKWDGELRGSGDEGADGRGIEWVGIDPAGLQRSEQTGLSNATVLRRAGFVVRARHGRVMEGVRAVKKRLGHGAVSPRLFVRRSCERLAESMQRYRFNPARTERLEPMKDGHDHVCDALRYLVLNLDGGEEEVVRIRVY